MAWEFINLSSLVESSTCNDTHLTIAGTFSSGTLPDDFTRNAIYKNDWENAFPAGAFMYGDTNLGLKYTGTAIELWKNGSIAGGGGATINMRWNWSDGASHNNIIYIAAIDRDREVGTLLVYKRYYGLEDTAWDAPPYKDTYRENGRNDLVESTDTYQILLGLIPVLYNWSSVPAISGKNGILLPMSTLNDINDGNEVTTSDTSKFNLNDRSNIKNLVDAVVNDF